MWQTCPSILNTECHCIDHSAARVSRSSTVHSVAAMYHAASWLSMHQPEPDRDTHVANLSVDTEHSVSRALPGSHRPGGCLTAHWHLFSHRRRSSRSFDSEAAPWMSLRQSSLLLIAPGQSGLWQHTECHCIDHSESRGAKIVSVSAARVFSRS